MAYTYISTAMELASIFNNKSTASSVSLSRLPGELLNPQQSKTQRHAPKPLRGCPASNDEVQPGLQRQAQACCCTSMPASHHDCPEYLEARTAGSLKHHMPVHTGEAVSHGCRFSRLCFATHVYKRQPATKGKWQLSCDQGSLQRSSCLHCCATPKAAPSSKLLLWRCKASGPHSRGCMHACIIMHMHFQTTTSHLRHDK